AHCRDPGRQLRVADAALCMRYERRVRVALTISFLPWSPPAYGFQASSSALRQPILRPTVQVGFSTPLPVLLSAQDVRNVLSMRDLIDAMEAALVRFSSREVAQPLRTVIEVGLQRAFVGVMPAFIPDPAALGTKVVSVFGSNTAVGLPTHLATIVLLD